MRIVGGSASCTVTVKVSVAVFPSASDAVHVTIVSPIAKFEPDTTPQVGPVVTPTLSDAVMANVAVAPAALEVVSVISFGTAMVGAAVSSGVYVSVTVKVSVVVFPSASDAVHVTVVVPIENVEPEAGSQVGPVVTATSSVAVASNVSAVPD